MPLLIEYVKGEQVRITNTVCNNEAGEHTEIIVTPSGDGIFVYGGDDTLASPHTGGALFETRRNMLEHLSNYFARKDEEKP
jgi:hypothetical protein